MTSYRTRENKNVEAVVTGSGHVLGIEFAHDAAHEDVFVTASEYVADLDIIAPRIYYIKPLTGKRLHSVFLVKSSSAVRVQIYEGPTVTVAGTRIPHMRNNRVGTIADNARDTTYHTPTKSADGALLYDTYTGGSSAVGQRAGGESRSGQEIVLKATGGYLVIITATVDNTIMSFSNEYYEVTV